MPGKLGEEITLFEVCKAERLGQQAGEERQPWHHSEDAAQLLFPPLWGLP